MFMFAGIDVSKEKLDLGWIRDVATGKKKTKIFTNTAKDHAAIAKWLIKNTKEKPQNIVVTLEPTNVYHEALIYFLHEQGFNIFLANPSKAKKYADSIGVIHKTDKIDSITLASFGHARQMNMEFWKPESDEVRALKALMRRLDALEKDLRRELNRQDSFEFSAASELVSRSLEAMIGALKAEIKKLETEIDDHIDRHPELKKTRKLLESVVGVGPVISRELTYLFVAKQFKKAKQVSAYLGLIPKLKESGKMKGRTTLSKMGPARIRAKLYMAAVVAGTHNGDIRAQKERLLAAGKTKMQAIGAAMRKLVQICFGVVNNEKEYQLQVS